jgi:hypothetical protein
MGDSERLKKLIDETTFEINVNGFVAASTGLRLIGYIRELERQLEQAREEVLNQIFYERR